MLIEQTLKSNFKLHKKISHETRIQCLYVCRIGNPYMLILCHAFLLIRDSTKACALSEVCETYKNMILNSIWNTMCWLVRYTRNFILNMQHKPRFTFKSSKSDATEFFTLLYTLVVNTWNLETLKYIMSCVSILVKQTRHINTIADFVSHLFNNLTTN